MIKYRHFVTISNKEFNAFISSNYHTFILYYLHLQTNIYIVFKELLEKRLPGVPTTIWQVKALSLSSLTDKPPIKLQHVNLEKADDTDFITEQIWAAISLVGVNIKT